LSVVLYWGGGKGHNSPESLRFPAKSWDHYDLLDETPERGREKNHYINIE
jgi:hypothetical protein